MGSNPILSARTPNLPFTASLCSSASCVVSQRLPPAQRVGSRLGLSNRSAVARPFEVACPTLCLRQRPAEDDSHRRLADDPDLASRQRPLTGNGTQPDDSRQRLVAHPREGLVELVAVQIPGDQLEQAPRVDAQGFTG